MTTLQAIEALYSYHRWADERLLGAAARVQESDLLRDEAIPFGSVQANLIHILGSQVSWLIRLTGEVPQLATIEPGRVVAALRQSFGLAHDRLGQYVASLTEHDVERVTSFIEFEENNAHNLERPLWEVLLSVGSHGISHRSEVAVVLTRLGASPEQMDYSEFAWRFVLRGTSLTEAGLAS